MFKDDDLDLLDKLFKDDMDILEKTLYNYGRLYFLIMKGSYYFVL